MNWSPSTLVSSSLRPTFANVRFLQLISFSLSGGPEPSDASDDDGSAVFTCLSTPWSSFHTVTSALRRPNGSLPLAMLLARPSQKFLLLNTAFTALDELEVLDGICDVNLFAI